MARRNDHRWTGLQASLKEKVVTILERSTDNNWYVAGGGFHVTNDTILTCFHVIQPLGQILVQRFNDDRQYIADVLRQSVGEDLALLKLRPHQYLNDSILTFAEEGSFDVGTKVAMLQHNTDIPYSFATGTIAYPCDLMRGRTWGSLFAEIDAEDSAVRLDENVRVVQVQSLHARSGSSGCPVVDENEQVVGILKGSLNGGVFDYLIHATVCKQFCNLF